MALQRAQLFALSTFLFLKLASSRTLVEDRGDFSFLVLGDWGGDSNSQPTSEGETCTAVGMSKVAHALGAQFVLAVGDNFYQAGIDSSTATNRFQHTFEEVYTDPSLNVDWWVVAGNHDHLGNVQLQIDYTKQSSRWKFPSLNYNVTQTLPNGKVVEFIMFDSVITAGLSFFDRGTRAIFAAQGPWDLDKASAQWNFVEDRLASSRADYLFTVAHYPVWSACEHASTPSLVRKLRPLMKKYGVTAHLSGHDHCLMHIQDGDSAHILSGAGAKAWYALSGRGTLGDGVDLKWYMAADNHENYKGGFAAVTIGNTGAVAKYYGDDGSLLFTSAPMPPRSSQRLRGEAVAL